MYLLQYKIYTECIKKHIYSTVLGFLSRGVEGFFLPKFGSAFWCSTYRDSVNVLCQKAEMCFSTLEDKTSSGNIRLFTQPSIPEEWRLQIQTYFFRFSNIL
jgi:hypothetical protein